MEKLNESPRQTLIAYMVAAGLQPSEIAARLREPIAHVTALTKSPDFQRFVAEVSREFRASLLQEVMDRLLAEVDASIDTVVQIRDVGKHEATRLQAAFGLLDRIVPRKSQVDETRTIRLSLAPEEVGQMRRALKQAPQEIGNAGDD